MDTVTEMIEKKVQELKDNQKGLCNICLDISDCPMLEKDEINTMELWVSDPIEFNNNGVTWCPMFEQGFEKNGDQGAGVRGNDGL